MRTRRGRSRAWARASGGVGGAQRGCRVVQPARRAPSRVPSREGEWTRSDEEHKPGGLDSLLIGISSPRSPRHLYRSLAPDTRRPRRGICTWLQRRLEAERITLELDALAGLVRLALGVDGVADLVVGEGTVEAGAVAAKSMRRQLAERRARQGRRDDTLVPEGKAQAKALDKVLVAAEVAAEGDEVVLGADAVVHVGRVVVARRDDGRRAERLAVRLERQVERRERVVGVEVGELLGLGLQLVEARLDEVAVDERASRLASARGATARSREGEQGRTRKRGPCAPVPHIAASTAPAAPRLGPG